MSSDLVAFLLARIDDTERQEHSRYSGGEVYDKPCPQCGERLTGYQQSFGESETELIPCGHVLTWEEFKVFAAVESRADRRVLADVQAKRAILEAYRGARARRDAYQADSARAVENAEQAGLRRSAAARCRGLEIAVELLAQPYASHPDFDPAWAVD